MNEAACAFLDDALEKGWLDYPGLRLPEAFSQFGKPQLDAIREFIEAAEGEEGLANRLKMLRFGLRTTGRVIGLDKEAYRATLETMLLD